MPLPLPNLDDRDFDQLMAQARRVLESTPAEWTDLSPGDPGTVLLELFAHLTETMIYRLNRLPEKAYVAFLRLIGVQLYPPAAAGVALIFRRDQARGGEAVMIPQGTRVTVSRPDGNSEPPVFVTLREATIPAGENEVTVEALHCELVDEELIGIGSGLPGLTFTLSRGPVIADSGDGGDLVIGVEATEAELQERAGLRPEARSIEDKQYRIWRETGSFTALGDDRFVFVADRMAGTVTFAPAARMPGDEHHLGAVPLALGEIPPAGREIRAWYRRGGGPAGNVAANTLTVLKDPIPGLQVTNPKPASGGKAAETLENAMVRGPQELHSLERAITARDFENLARNVGRGAVSRARAFTRLEVWAHAAPGSVEVLLVPELPTGAGEASVEALEAAQSQLVQRNVVQALQQSRPLGTTCVVNWVRYKTVQVQAHIVVGRQEIPAAVEERVTRRLAGAISPVPTPYSESGWPFGRSLRASDVYNIILSEPGVRWVEGTISFRVAEAPRTNVRTIAADFHQPDTWFVGSDGPAGAGVLFRSLNGGAGWEPAWRAPEGRIVHVEPHQYQAGMVAVIVELPEQAGAQVYLSRDCGEGWVLLTQFAFPAEDLAWVRRGGDAVLLLATANGLYELPLTEKAVPVKLVVEPEELDLGFYALAAVEEIRGVVSVAAAAYSRKGVYLSNDGGRSESFRKIGLEGKEVQRLAIQRQVAQAQLWAGIAATGGDEGEGCQRWALTGGDDPPEGWRAFSAGWKGGSCRDLAFSGAQVFAATHRSGVLWWDRKENRWRGPSLESGLRLREAERIFQPVFCISGSANNDTIMAGGGEGVFRTQDGGEHYDRVSNPAFTDSVTLPPTWLFVSGKHEITVSHEERE